MILMSHLKKYEWYYEMSEEKNNIFSVKRNCSEPTDENCTKNCRSQALVEVREYNQTFRPIEYKN